jgi:hypothetical protein
MKLDYYGNGPDPTKYPPSALRKSYEVRRKEWWRRFGWEWKVITVVAMCLAWTCLGLASWEALWRRAGF